MRFLLGFTLILPAACALAQQGNSPSTLAAPKEAAQPSSSGQESQPETPPAQPGTSGSPTATRQSGANQAQPPIPVSKQQPKRILGVMPNYRAVSAGAIPPPPTPKQAFKIATQNSFDYSAFVFVGITSLLAEGTDAHPRWGKARKALEGITGVVSSIRPTGITWYSSPCRLSFIRTSATLRWGRAHSGSAVYTRPPAFSSRPIITGIIASMFLSCWGEAFPREFRRPTTLVKAGRRGRWPSSLVTQ